MPSIRRCHRRPVAGAPGEQARRQRRRGQQPGRRREQDAAPAPSSGSKRAVHPDHDLRRDAAVEHHRTAMAAPAEWPTAPAIVRPRTSSRSATARAMPGSDSCAGAGIAGEAVARQVGRDHGEAARASSGAGRARSGSTRRCRAAAAAPAPAPICCTCQRNPPACDEAAGLAVRPVGAVALPQDGRSRAFRQRTPRAAERAAGCPAQRSASRPRARARQRRAPACGSGR